MSNFKLFINYNLHYSIVSTGSDNINMIKVVITTNRLIQFNKDLRIIK